MQSLSGAQEKLERHYKDIAPDQIFYYREVIHGFLGTKFFPRAKGIEIIWQPHQESLARIPIAEAGVMLKLSNPSYDRKIKLDPFYAEVFTVKGDDKKYHPLYNPDDGKENGNRLFSPSILIKIIKDALATN